jgi:hypothetical protein
VTSKKRDLSETRVTDAAIDRVAKEMLDHEPAADVRDRVLRRIDAAPRSLRWVWFAAPVAAAAILIIAILLPRSNRTVPGQPGIDRPRPVETPIQSAAGTGTRPPTVQAAAPRPVARTVRATTVSEPLPPVDDQSVPPLSSPEPLSVVTIGSGRSTPITPMQLAPISLKPLEVDALDDRPQERQE